jgi:WD40 repeat protein
LTTLTGHSDWLFALTLLPNGLIASGSSDTTIKIWNGTKTFPLYTLTGHTMAVRALVVINTGFIASGAQDGTIKLWSLSSYSLVNSWTASTSYIMSLAFDSTLNVLASGDSSHLVKIWDSNIWSSDSTKSSNLLFFLNKIMLFIE